MKVFNKMSRDSLEAWEGYVDSLSDAVSRESVRNFKGQICNTLLLLR